MARAATVVLVLGMLVISPDVSAQEEFDTEYATKVLFMAVDKNDLPGVRAAIEGGANVEAVNPLGMQAVDIAVDRGYYDIAHYLISVRTLFAEKAKNNPPISPALTTSPAASPAPAPAEEWAARVTVPAATETIIVEAPANAPAETPIETPVETVVAVTPEPEAKPELPVMEKAEPQTLIAETLTTTPVPLSRPEIPKIEEVKTAEAKTEEVSVPPVVAEPTVVEAVEEVATETPEEVIEEEIIQIAEAPLAEPVPEPETAAIETDVAPEKTTDDVATLESVESVVEKEEVISQTTVTAELPPELLSEPEPEPLPEPSSELPGEPSPSFAADAIEMEIDPEPAREVEVAVEVARAQPPKPEPIPEPIPEPEPEPEAEVTPKPEALPEVFEAPAKAETIAPIAEVAETQSATMRFFSTFLDFFKPPNTTGVVRTVKRDPEQDKINVSQQSSRSAVEPRDGGVEASVLAQQLKDLEQQQSEFLINNPPPQELPAEETEEEEIELVFEDDTEPEQDAEETAATEPDIVPDPFATPTDVGKLEAKLPPHPAEEGDEVAATEEEIPGLEGLLDSTDESAPPAGSGGEDSLGEEWALKELDSASLPDVEIPSASDIIASGEMLEGVHLALGEDVHIGQEFTEKRRQLMKQETIHRPCVDKHGDGTVFCIDTVFWPLDIEENFRVDTIMYQGTRAIARYDDGLATNFHAMFDSNAFDIIANYYTNRYGSPTKSIARAIAPFAKPRQENPTMIWQSREPGTDLVINLEIRKFDDARGGFPDTERGAIMLYKNHAEPIFPKLSQLELMVLEPDDKATAGLTSSEPATPDSVW